MFLARCVNTAIKYSLSIPIRIERESTSCDYAKAEMVSREIYGRWRGRLVSGLRM